MEHGTCRSCAAPLRWARTDKGKRTPMDPEPNMDKGNMILLRFNGGELAVHLSAIDEVAREAIYTHGVERYVSHFATCPDAKGHRR